MRDSLLFVTEAIQPFSIWARWGRTWFQWRSFSPLVWVVPVVFLRPEFELGSLSAGWIILPLLTIVIAEGLRLWGVAYAGSPTRTRSDHVPSLVHAGPFRYLRNPLYVGNILLYTATGLLFGFAQLSVFIFLYSVIQYAFIVAYEEELLVATFGSAYEDYQLAVPRWLPLLSPGCEPSAHKPSLVAAIKSEKSTFFSMLGVVILWLIKNTIQS